MGISVNSTKTSYLLNCPSELRHRILRIPGLIDPRRNKVGWPVVIGGEAGGSGRAAPQGAIDTPYACVC